MAAEAFAGAGPGRVETDALDHLAEQLTVLGIVDRLDPQGLAGLGAGAIEFAGLAYDDRSSAMMSVRFVIVGRSNLGFPAQC